MIEDNGKTDAFKICLIAFFLTLDGHEVSKNISISVTNAGIHMELLTTKNLIYDKCEFLCSSIVAEAESSEYGAYSFEINNMKILFRIAKITPKKVGQFVTAWKRIGKGPIQPYDSIDSVDLLVVCTKNGDYFGQFVFPTAVLLEQNIFSTNGKGGKRGFRVYPLWDIAINKQAQKTQKWQLKYFLNIPNSASIDCSRAKALYLSQKT